VPQAPLVPPFTQTTAIGKVRAAEDAWNSRDPERVALAYTEDSHWRNRGEIIEGREEIKQFLARKWVKELDYRLIKEMWAFGDDRIACASNTNGTTTPGNGIGHTETNCGSSTRAG